MNFGNCKNCNKAIKYDSIPLCSECEEKFFLKVRDFIYENGPKTADEIHKATGVPKKVINYFIENGSLYSSIENKVSQEEQEKMEKIRILSELRELKKNLEVSSISENKDMKRRSAMHFYTSEEINKRRK